MIIGVVGFIGSGKGTVGDILERDHGFKKLAFADPLKDSVATIFGWPRNLLEGDTEESRAFRETVDPWWTEIFGFDVTPRLMLQKFGTEACRHGIADNIWIAALQKRLAFYENVIVTDVRFPNEIDFIRSAGGVIVRVNRGPVPSAQELAEMHVSETAWLSHTFPDYGIDNDGTIEELKQKVNLILTIESKPDTIFHHPV